MRKVLIWLLFVLFIVQIVSAAEVCVVADYGKGSSDEDSENKPDSKCVDIEEGKNGYELMEKTGWSLLWSPASAYGHMLCKINDVGTDVSGQYCGYSGDYWNIVLNRDGKWLHLPVGLDSPGNCWNYDIASWNGHYCIKNGDVLGFAFGSSGAEPEMFKANISKVYVDGEKQTKLDQGGGKVKNVFPGSNLELKAELENLYDSSTDIQVRDISIKGTIEEIDNGDDIEEEIDEFDLDAGRKDTSKTLKFKIPIEVEAKDRLLKIALEAVDDAGIRYEKEFNYDLEIEKKQNKLKIITAKLNKDSYKCGENALLDFSIINIGVKDEKVKLEIRNTDLGADITEDFELSNDVFEESSKYGKKFNIRLNNSVNKATYPTAITASYGTEKEIANVNLVVGECDKQAVVKSRETEEAKYTQKVTDVGTGKSNQEGGIAAVKEIESKETAKTEEKITNNLPLVLMVVFGILIALIIALLAIFWVLRR